jgi:hypothetical protein
MATIVTRSVTAKALAGPKTLHPIALRKLGVKVPEVPESPAVVPKETAFSPPEWDNDDYSPTSPTKGTWDGDDYSPTTPTGPNDDVRYIAECYWDNIHARYYTDKTPEEQQAAKEHFVRTWVFAPLR